MEAKPKNIIWTEKANTINFMDEKTTHDRVLLVEKTKFYVLYQYLSICSGFFEVLFNNNNFKEANQAVIPIEGVKAADFNMFLLAIYSTSQKVTANNLSILIDLSFRFLAPSVLDMCRELINSDFEILDKIGLLEISFRCEFDGLKERCATFIKTQLEFLSRLYTCKSCEKKKTMEDQNSVGFLQCCGRALTINESKQMRVLMVEDSEYLKQNKERLQLLPTDCRTYLFSVIFGI